MRLKNNVKTGVFFLLNLFSALLPKNRAVILLYHSIDKNDVFLTLPPEIFSRQMRYLKEKKYNVVSLAYLVDLLKAEKSILPKTIVLTFDDGFLSHFETVLPILKEFNFPATFFISVKPIGGEINNSQNLPQATMSWEQIKEMNKSNLIDIQPHGLSHKELDKLSADEIFKEIKKSKEIFEKELGKQCKFFAPPRGASNKEILEAIESSGFEAALTIYEGLVKKGNSLFTLKRNTIDSSCTNLVQFKGRLSWAIVLFNKMMLR